MLMLELHYKLQKAGAKTGEAAHELLLVIHNTHPLELTHLATDTHMCSLTLYIYVGCKIQL